VTGRREESKTVKAAKTAGLGRKERGHGGPVGKDGGKTRGYASEVEKEKMVMVPGEGKEDTGCNALMPGGGMGTPV